MLPGIQRFSKLEWEYPIDCFHEVFHFFLKKKVEALRRRVGRGLGDVRLGRRLVGLSLCLVRFGGFRAVSSSFLGSS